MTLPAPKQERWEPAIPAPSLKLLKPEDISSTKSPGEHDAPQAPTTTAAHDEATSRPISVQLLDGELASLRELRPSNPRRPVDWRWQLAGHLRQLGPKSVPVRPDSPVIVALRLQRALDRCHTADDLDKIRSCTSPYPQMLEALELWRGEDNLRHELEARLLAREELAAIAAKIGISQETIRQYQSIFFDVDARLDSPGYITHTVISQKHEECGPENFAPYWKSIGYTSQSGDVLDQLIYGRCRSSDPLVRRKVSDFFRRDAWQILAVKAAIGIRTIALEEPGAMVRFLRASLRMRELELKHSARRSAADMSCNLEAFASQMSRIGTGGSALSAFFGSSDHCMHSGPSRSQIDHIEQDPLLNP